MKLIQKYFLCVLIFLLPAHVFSQDQQIDAALKSASDFLSTRIPKGMRIAVLNFSSDWPDLSSYVVDELSGNFVETGFFTVVDRSNLELIQQEMHFQFSGEVSEESAQSIGQKLGAQAIVSGSILDTGSGIRLRTRVISVETTQILGMHNVNLRQDNRVATLTKLIAPVQSMPAARAAPASASKNSTDAEGGKAVPAAQPVKSSDPAPAAKPAARAVPVARPTITTPPARKPFIPKPAQDGFVLMNAGTFLMGSPSGELKRKSNEADHVVRISAFYMGEKEVTQFEYQAVMGRNPSRFKGSKLPVERVTWFDAVEYCNRASRRDGLTPAYIIDGEGRKRTVRWNMDADGYRLPTESEWEYACRAGSMTPFNTSFGSGYNITTAHANFNGAKVYGSNSIGINRKKSTDAGSFEPNAFGLYDMHGNVMEWCWDIFGKYSKEIQVNPVGAVKGSRRVQRGGSWKHSAQFVRSAQRLSAGMNSKNAFTGFRIAQSAVQPVSDKIVKLNRGVFTMGSPVNEPERGGDENRRQVTLSSFYMAKHPVTIADFWYFINDTDYKTDAEKSKNGYIFNNNNWDAKEDANWKYSYMSQVNSHPVVLVSWNDAFQYCNWLSEQESLVPVYTISGKSVTMNMNVNGYRLPTEAEWEYACRGGTTTPFGIGENITAAQVNFNGNNPYNGGAKGTYRERTTPVGSFKPNEWDLYDMHGNVSEMCWDWYGPYSDDLQTNPTGSSSGSRRVTRGGGWINGGAAIRSAARSNASVNSSNNALGFRIARSVIE